MPQNILPVFHFQVSWGGTNAGFSEVTGLSIDSDVIEYRDGYSPEFNTVKMPGLKKFVNIVLKRGILPRDSEFFAWLNTTKMHKPERREVSISLLNENHDPVVTWKVKNAWPTKVDGPSLNAKTNEVAIETIDLAHEGITIEYH